MVAATATSDTSTFQNASDLAPGLKRVITKPEIKIPKAENTSPTDPATPKISTQSIRHDFYV